MPKSLLGARDSPEHLRSPQPRWINVRPVREPAHLPSAQQRFGLGTGETSVIVLWRELRADVLLLYDMKARTMAKQKGMAVLGCVGVLYDAFVLKFLPDLTVAFRQLLSSGAYVDRGLLDNILKVLSLPPL
jgi:predicted nucleic acid-binding protein